MSPITALPLRKKKLNLAPYLLILPAVLMLLFALGYPVGWQFWTSFHEYGLAQQFGQPPEFVGLDNYTELFSAPETWRVVGISLAFCAINAFLTVLIGVLLALLMNAIPTGARLALQIGMLLAWAMPVTAAMTVWNWLFDWHHGVVNWVLTELGLNFTGHVWLGTNIGLWSVATVIIVWMSVPFVAFSVYAGLTQVSTEVIEASQLDGAGGWQRFWNVIVPTIKPVLMIVLLLQIIWDLRVFTQIRMLQDVSNPLDSDLLGTYLYTQGIGGGNISMASALSVFVLILTIAISSFYVVQLLKEDN